MLGVREITRATMMTVAAAHLPELGSLLRPADRLAGLGPNVFVHFTQLANKFGAVNLGQGTFAGQPAGVMRESILEAMDESVYQYSRPAGNLKLMDTLCRYYSEVYGRQLDPQTNFTAGVGAQGLIGDLFLAYMQPGDEYLVLEPYFDVYIQGGLLSQSTPKGIPYIAATAAAKRISNANEFTFDFAKIEQEITSKTKMLIINTPNNPLGKLHTHDELVRLADIVKRHPQLMVVSDEVYEFMTFEAQKHVYFASLPGMFERTVSIYSAGKTFSSTGLRLGYAVGPASLIKPLMTTHQTLNFCGVTLIEEAYHKAFLKTLPGVADPSEANAHRHYMRDLAGMLERNRDLLLAALDDVGLSYVKPNGGYFVLADTRDLDLEKMGVRYDETSTKVEDQRDYQLALWFTETLKVACIPMSPFFSPENRHLAKNYLRLAYCKDEDSLKEAHRRLLGLKPYIKSA